MRYEESDDEDASGKQVGKQVEMMMMPRVMMRRVVMPTMMNTTGDRLGFR
jgi:hypothetical protein